MFFHRARTTTSRDVHRKSSTIRRDKERRCSSSWDPTNLVILQKLPSSATSYHEMESFEWGPTLRTILEGVRDEQSPFHALRGKEDTVVDHIFSFVSAKYGDSVTLTLPAHAIGGTHGRDVVLKFDSGPGKFGRVAGRLTSRHVPQADLHVDPRSLKPLLGLVSYVSVGMIEKFPEPQGRNVNMMPFVFGEKESLPEEYQDYYDLIEQCPYLAEEIGEVGYLTVHESFVDASSAQRREGIHIEAPGTLTTDNTDQSTSLFTPGAEHRWGMGMFYDMDRLEGGIFMASTVADTSQVWDALVDHSKKGIVDRHGGCDHIRHLLGPGKKLKANELIWMTDRTPHEALPQTESAPRQFFRVVTSKISHWFADHSTPNPLVPLPDHVVVVRGNKFEAC